MKTVYYCQKQSLIGSSPKKPPDVGDLTPGHLYFTSMNPNHILWQIFSAIQKISLKQPTYRLFRAMISLPDIDFVQNN